MLVTDAVAASAMNIDAENDRISLIVHRTLNDNARREWDIVVSGKPETDIIANDGIEFLRLCEQNVSTEPHNIGYDSCRRLDKF